MTRYYVFRHGQTLYSKLGVPYLPNNKQVSILPEAYPVIEKLAEGLKGIKPDLSVSSEFKRCQETTQIVSKVTGLQFTLDPRLNEYGGETFDNFKKRIADFLAEVEAKKFEVVVICTHGAGMAALKHLLLNGDFQVGQLVDYPKPGVLITIYNGKLSITDFN